MKQITLALAAALCGVLCLLSTPASAQESDLDRLLEDLSPAERFARRVTPEALVAQKAASSVVFIETDLLVKRPTFWGVQTQVVTGSGSGMVIREDGYIMTNYHVVRGARSITVSFDPAHDTTRYEADLLSFVVAEDLALLRIKGGNGKRFPTVPVGTSSDLMIGERVVAIGNPYGHTHTVSVGIISGLHRDITVGGGDGNPNLHFDDLIQTDASINRGNSGGPLLNINGELIGINNAVNAAAENIGFAIPIDRVRQVLEDQLIAPNRARTWLGFELRGGDELEVEEVLPGGPAFLAGLEAGDRILELAGRPIEGQQSYQFARASLQPNASVQLKVHRRGRERVMTLKAWPKADGLLFERLGVTVQENATRYSNFLTVGSVLDGSAASEVGLQPGDVINAVRPKTVNRIYRLSRRNDLASLISQLEPEEQLELDISREGQRYKGTLLLR